MSAIAFDELGEGSAADELLDFDRLLRCTQLTAPPGFASLAAFNAELTAQTLSHPTLHVPPPGDPRYHCPTLRMTAEFCIGSSGASAALAVMVACAVDAYVKDLARVLPQHPFVAGAPRRFQLISWATVLDGEGNLEPHVHYSSYVSAVSIQKYCATWLPPRAGRGTWNSAAGQPGFRAASRGQRALSSRGKGSCYCSPLTFITARCRSARRNRA